MKRLFLALIFLFFHTTTSYCWETIVGYEEESATPSQNQASAATTYSQTARQYTASGDPAPGNKELLNCLCGCAMPGTNFSCSYDTKSKGHSPSCRNLDNGPCFCVAYGCVRKPIPSDSECTKKCREQFSEPEPVDCEEELATNLSVYFTNNTTCRPTGPPFWVPSSFNWQDGKYPDETTGNMRDFQFCYDPLFLLLGKNLPPKSNRQPGEKEYLYQELMKQGYTIVDSRLTPSNPPSANIWVSEVNGNSLQVQEGDVMLLGFSTLTPFTTLPNGDKLYTAPHYLIMGKNKYFSQILNATSRDAAGNLQEGFIDKKRHIKYPFDTRDLTVLTRPSRSGNNYTKGRPYRTYIILRKP